MGSNFIFSKGRTLESVPVVSTSAYTSGDVLVATQSYELGERGAAGLIRTFSLQEAGTVKAPFTVYLFRAAPSVIAANAAFAPTAADMDKCFGTITVAAGDYATVNSISKVFKNELNIDFELPDTESKFYVYLVTSGTPTYAAADKLSKIRFNVFVY